MKRLLPLFSGLLFLATPAPAPVPFPDQGDTSMDGKIDLAELTELFRAFQAGGGQLPPSPPPQTPPG